MFNENIRVSLTDQVVDNLIGWLRRAYIDATELTLADKTILVKFIVKEYMRSTKPEWKTVENVTTTLIRLCSIFNASRSVDDKEFEKHEVNFHHNTGSLINSNKRQNDKNGLFHCDDVVFGNLVHRLQVIFFGDNANDFTSDCNDDPIIDKSKLAHLVHVAERLERRFQSTGQPLLTILEKLEDILAAKDASFSVATKASFDRIIDSLNPNACGSVDFDEKSNIDSDNKAKLLDTLTAKHMQLSMYHKQGRLVKDCKIMYKQQLKKYGF